MLGIPVTREIDATKFPARAMVNPINDHPIRIAMHAKNNPVGEIDEMTNLPQKVPMFGNQGQALGQVLKRIDRLNEPPKPSLRRLRFLLDVADEPHILFGVSCSAASA